MRTLLVILAVATGACSTKAETVAVMPTTTAMAAPAAVAAAFMQAVADSNFAQMGELWGNAKGAAAVTREPANWVQRVAVMHAYLRGGTARVVGENPGFARDDRRQVVVALTRDGCTKNVPFTMILTRQGTWLVNNIDLNAAGVPGRPCQGGSGT